jgi:hypothetical protein
VTLADSTKSLMPVAGKCWEHGQGLDPKLMHPLEVAENHSVSNDRIKGQSICRERSLVSCNLPRFRRTCKLMESPRAPVLRLFYGMERDKV